MEEHGPVMLMRHHLNRLERLFDDPNLSGDVLLMAISLARGLDFGRDDDTVDEACRSVFGRDRAGALRGMAALATDMPAPGRPSRLAEHFPALQWLRIWARVDPTWEAPAGLVLPDAGCTAEAPRDAARPVLSVVPPVGP